MKNLQEKSPIYYSQAEVYDLFSRAEDADGLVLSALKPLVSGKSLLDLGCGTGKYLELLSPFASRITGLDAAAAQLDVARHRATGLRNVTLVQGDALTEDLGHHDVVLASWMLGTITDEQKRTAILRCAERAGRHIVLVENAEGGAFEALRGRVDDPLSRTRRYNDWLLSQGFAETHRLEARFRFGNLQQAQDVFAAIWGEEKRVLMVSAEIGHKIAIYQKQIAID